VIARGLLLFAAVLAFASCVVHRLTGPRLTGTCDGACSHYVECKPTHSSGDGDRCRSECPEVLSDRDSLMAYESLSCPDAVEYIDGNVSRTTAATGAGNR
jgi:hypothetical protein